MKTTLKVLGFVALLVVYSLFSGATGWDSLFGRKLAVVYGFGAVMALWFGGERIGTLHPVSLRSIFIALGVILMVSAFIIMLTTRDLVSGLQGVAPNQGAEVLKGCKSGHPAAEFLRLTKRTLDRTLGSEYSPNYDVG